IFTKGSYARPVTSWNGDCARPAIHDRVQVWDAREGKELFTLKGHKGLVLALVYSADGRWIVTGSTDQYLKVWEATTGDCVRDLLGHSNYVQSVAISPDGTRIASASIDQSIRLWEL